jgi:O-antigen/teichoic acid export membrane protein
MWLIACPLLLQALSLPVTAYIIHTLGAGHYGQWATATAITAAIAFVSNLGLRTLFVRSIALEPGSTEELLATQLGLRTALAAAAAGIAICACQLLGYPPVVLSCTLVASLGLVLSAMWTVLGDVVQAFQQYRTFAKISLFAGVVLTVSSLIVIAMGCGPIGLSVAYLSGPIISLAMFWWVVRRKYCAVRMGTSLSKYREVLSKSRVIASQQVVSAARDQAEQLLIPKLVGITSFGYFAAGALIPSRLGFVPENLSSAFYPEIARLHAQSGRAAAHLVARLALFSMMLCLPLAVLLVFLAHPIARILFPRAPEICASIIRITAWSIPATGVLSTFRNALQAAGKYNEVARTDMRSAAVTLGLSVFFIARFGIIGGCWSYVLRPFISACMLSPWFIRSFPDAIANVPLVRILSSATLMALLLWQIARIPMPAMVAITAGTIIASAAYLLTLVGLRVIQVADISSIFGRGAGISTVTE